MAMMFRGPQPYTTPPYAPAPITDTSFGPPSAASSTASGKPNWAGIAADFLAGLAGQGPVFAPMQAAEKQRRQALEDAAAQRQASVADWIAKQQYQAANPGPTKIEQDLAAWQKFTPEQKAAYQEMHPEYRQGPDGQFYRINIAGNMPAPASGALPTFSQDDWDKAGGSAGNGTGGFPR